MPLSPIYTVYLDMDGVLTDFPRAALRVHGVEPTDEMLLQADQLHEALGITAEAFWQKIDDAGIDFWAQMPAYPWARDLIEMVDGFAREWYVCSTPSQAPWSTSGKVAWLQQFFQHDPELQRRYILTPHKHTLSRPFTVLIDDKPENCQEYDVYDGRSILFPQPWNMPDCRDDLTPTGERRLLYVKNTLTRYQCTPSPHLQT